MILNNEFILVEQPPIANQTVSGNIVGLNPDVASSWVINQTTAGLTFTIATPSAAASSKKGLVQLITNGGSAPFTLYGALISFGQSVLLKYSGTAWTIVTAPPAANAPDFFRDTTGALPNGVGDNTKNIATQGFLGVGKTVPVLPLDVYRATGVVAELSNDAANGVFISSSYNSSATHTSMVNRAARGTGAAPLAVISGDQLTHSFALHDGTSFYTAALTRYVATENFSPTTRGTRLDLYTTPIGTASSVISLTVNGTRVGVNNNTNPLSNLDVLGSVGINTSSTAAAAYTVLDTDYAVNLTLNGLQTVTIPAATALSRRIIVLVNPTVTDKVVSTYTNLLGSTSTVLIANSSLTLQSDGTVWRQIAGGGGSLPTIQQINATGTVAAWNSTVEIGATALTANITITLPTVVGNIGKEIIFIRRDATAFTVTLAAAGGQTLTLKNTGTELSQQNGALTVQAIDATNARQTSNIGVAPVIAEFTTIAITNQVFATNTFADSTNGIFALPSAGTWKLRYDLTTDGTGANANSQFQIVDGAGAVVAGTTRTRGGSVTTSLNLTAEVTVVTTGAVNYKLQGRNGGSGSVTIVNSTISGSSISWEKIGGQIPVTGQSVDYVQAALTATQTTNIAAGDHVKFDQIQANGGVTLDTATAYVNTTNTPSIGRFTLLANKTYKLESFVTPQVAAGGRLGYAWFNSDTGVMIGEEGSHFNVQYTDTNANIAPAQGIFTPTVNTRVEVRLTGVVSITGLYLGDSNIAGTRATITQIGSSAYSTLNTYVGASAGTAGVTGGVPVALAGQQSSILKGDGTWGDMFVAPFTATGAANLVVTNAMYTINTNNGATAITVTLPTPVGIAGKQYIVKRDFGSTGIVTVATAAGQVQAISGTFAATASLSALGAYGQSLHFQSDGINWHRIN